MAAATTDVSSHMEADPGAVPVMGEVDSCRRCFTLPRCHTHVCMIACYVCRYIPPGKALPSRLRRALQT